MCICILAIGQRPEKVGIATFIEDVGVSDSYQDLQINIEEFGGIWSVGGIRSTWNKTNNFHIQRILKSNRIHTEIFVFHRYCALAQILKPISKISNYIWFQKRVTLPDFSDQKYRCKKIVLN